MIVNTVCIKIQLPDGTQGAVSSSTSAFCNIFKNTKMSKMSELCYNELVCSVNC